MASEQVARFNVHEAKTQLSRLIERVEAGEEIIISRAGKPVARLIPLRRPTARRRPGAWRGRVVLHDDFDELPEAITRAFGGHAP